MSILRVKLHCGFFQVVSAFILFLCIPLTASNDTRIMTASNDSCGKTDLNDEIVLTDSKNVTGGTYEHFYYRGPFYSFYSILELLKCDSYRNSSKVRDLMITYETNCPKPSYDGIPTPSRLNRHPFFVVEGSRKFRKKNLAMMLAESLGAKLFYGLPHCLNTIRGRFNKSSEVKGIFYSFCCYVHSFKIRYLLKHTPIVLNGYWMHQSAFLLAKKNPETLPPIGSDVYEFPKDLLKPDLVVYHNSKSIHSNVGFVDRVAEIYRRMRNPGIYEIKDKHITHSVILSIRHFIRENVAPKFKHLNYL